MTTLLIQPSSDDTYLKQSEPTVNFGTNTRLKCGYGTPKASNGFRMLVKFDVSSLPALAIIESVTLSMMNSGGLGGTTNIIAHRCLKNWTNAGATWNTINGSTAWKTAGCNSPGVDFSASTLGSFSSVEDVDGTWRDAILNIEEFLNLRTTNYGFVLYGGIPSDATAQEFYSNDAATASKKPKLTIEYHLPDSGCQTII